MFKNRFLLTVIVCILSLQMFGQDVDTTKIQPNNYPGGYSFVTGQFKNLFIPKDDTLGKTPFKGRLQYKNSNGKIYYGNGIQWVDINGSIGSGGTTDTSRFVNTTVSYNNPAWLTALAYSKITGVPSFITSETDPKRVTSVAITGTTTKTVTLTLADATTITGTFSDLNSGSGSVAWGSVTGTLSSQTDLQSALNAKQNTITTGTTGQYVRGDLSLATFPTIPAAVDTTPLHNQLVDHITAINGKVDKNASITAATKTKITYGANGMVTAGADATTADIAASTNKNYVTDAQLTVIGNTSGTNSGDQDLSSYKTIAAHNTDTATLGSNSRALINATNTAVASNATAIATETTNRTNADALKQNLLTPGTNISIVGNTISATGSSGSVTVDSSRVSYAETKIVTIPLGSTILYLGDSYFTLGGSYNIPLIVDSLTGSFADNRAIGGTGVNTSISQAFKYDSLGKFKPTFIEIGLNNLSFCGSSIGTIESIKGGIRSHIVNHFLASAIPASASTQSSGWTNVTAGTIGAKADLSLSGNAVTVSTAGATLTYTTPATTSIAIGTFGSDSTTSDYGRFNYTINGVLFGTWVSNGKNRYNSTFNLPLSQQVIVVNNLARTTHTVVITTLDAKPVVVDYFGTMIIKDAGLQPLLIASIPRLTDSGYRAAILRIDNINSDRGVDSGSRAILSVLNEFSSFNYPLAFVDVNKYLQVPNDISADSVHPTSVGSYKIANSYMEHVSAWQGAVQSFDVGKPNANRIMRLSSLTTGGGTFIGPSFVGLNTASGNVTVSNPQSTATNLLDINGFANNPRIRVYSTTAALTWTLQAGYNMVAWNIDPDLGTYKNSGVPGGLIKFNTTSGNGAIDFYLSNTNGGGGTFVSRWSVLGLKLGSNANPAAQLDIIGGTTTQPQIKLNPGVLTAAPGIGNIENDSISNVLFFTDKNGLRKPIAPWQVTTTGINAKTAASTALYTVPTGKTLVVTRCVVRITAASGITTGLSASVTASTSGTIYTSNAMTGLTAAPQLFKFPDDGLSVTASAGETISFVIGTAASGTSQTVAVDLIGYLL